MAGQTTAPLSITVTGGYACEITKLYSVTAVGLTMFKAVNGAAARRINLPFIQDNNLVKLGLAVLIEVEWWGIG